MGSVRSIFKPITGRTKVRLFLCVEKCRYFVRISYSLSSYILRIRDRLFGAEELKRIHKCIGFALENDDSLDFVQEKELFELKERLGDLIPSQAENQEQGFQGLTMQ